MLFSQHTQAAVALLDFTWEIFVIGKRFHKRSSEEYTVVEVQ